jgi:hypothetical protein
VTDTEPQMSPAVKVASAMGLFVLAALAVPALLLGGAYLLVALDFDSGWGAIGILFGVVGAATVALLASARLRPAGIGAVLSLALSGAAVWFYAVVLQAGDF